MSTDIETYQKTTSLQPRDLGEAMTLAQTLAKSGIVPYALRGKPADILVIMMYGMELGLSVNQAMRGINVIKGRPSLSTELRVSKTRERGHQVGVVCAECGEWAGGPTHSNLLKGHRYVADWTRERCTVKAVRNDTGETAVITWTIEDAVDARLLTPGKGPDQGKLVARSDKNEPLPWEAYTKDMLYARAADRACKQIAPEVAYGLYTREEAEAMPDEPTRVTAQVGEPVTAEAIHHDAATLREAALKVNPWADDPQYAEAVARGATHVDIVNAGSPAHWLADDDQARVIDETTEAPPFATWTRYEETGERWTDDQRKRIMATLNQVGLDPKDRDRRLAMLSRIVRVRLITANELTVAMAGRVIDALDEAATKDDPLTFLDVTYPELTEGEGS